MADPRPALMRLVKLMVDRSQDVSIEDVRQGEVTVFQLRAADDDLGKVIGRRGRTARALRSLLSVRGKREGERYELEILED